jgi:hypothetical protein
VAKRAKPADAVRAQGVNEGDLKKVIQEVLHQKELASEYNGRAGSYTKDAVERYGLDRRALAVSVALTKADEKKRAATVRACLDYWQKLGFFDQMDAFDDLVGTMEKIASDARSRSGTSNGSVDPVVSTVLQ